MVIYNQKGQLAWQSENFELASPVMAAAINIANTIQTKDEGMVQAILAFHLEPNIANAQAIVDCHRQLFPTRNGGFVSDVQPGCECN